MIVFCYRLVLMDLDRLHIFVKIVDAGSMSAASRLVHLTQPALSRNLRLLEEELATDLFDRVGRRLVLTPAGRALLPRARALLAQASTVARDIERIAGRQYFDLRVGTVDSVATFLFQYLVGDGGVLGLLLKEDVLNFVKVCARDVRFFTEVAFSVV